MPVTSGKHRMQDLIAQGRPLAGAIVEMANSRNCYQVTEVWSSAGGSEQWVRAVRLNDTDRSKAGSVIKSLDRSSPVRLLAPEELDRGRQLVDQGRWAAWHDRWLNGESEVKDSPGGTASPGLVEGDHVFTINVIEDIDGPTAQVLAAVPASEQGVAPRPAVVWQGSPHTVLPGETRVGVEQKLREEAADVITQVVRELFKKASKSRG